MPLSEEFLIPFERRALEAALSQLGYLERANELVRLGLAPDVALVDAFIDWYRAHPPADNTDHVNPEESIEVEDWEMTLHFGKGISVRLAREDELVYGYYRSPVRSFQLGRFHDGLRLVDTYLGVRAEAFLGNDKILDEIRKAIVEDGLTDYVGSNTWVRIGRWVLSPALSHLYHNVEEAKRTVGEVGDGDIDQVIDEAAALGLLDDMPGQPDDDLVRLLTHVDCTCDRCQAEAASSLEGRGDAEDFETFDEAAALGLLDDEKLPKVHLWRYDATEPNERRPWIVSFEGRGDAEDFETFDEAAQYVREMLP